MCNKALLLASVGTIACLGGFSGPAAAQLFCPPGFTFVNGFCVSPFVPGPPPNTTSGFSVAALSSEALSEVAESVSQETTSTTLEAVRERRLQAVQACPDGFERVQGECRRIRRPVATRRQPSAPMMVKALPPPQVPVQMGYTPAVWAQVFGDFEQRSHLTSPAMNDLGEKTGTVGVLGGIDYTGRNVQFSGDVLIFGALGGYSDSDVHFINSNTVAHVRGPSVGAYATYANGPFSMDTTFKADIFDLGESFSEVIPGAPGNPPILNTGSASVSMTNYNAASNFNYRLPQGPYWVEPTVGFRYTDTLYGSGATALGLTDGHIWRVQGGARIGADYDWNGIHLTQTLTGLAYSDVEVTGGAIQNGGFLGPTSFTTDQGKVRGQGIWAVKLDYLNGYSVFAQADVRAGQNYYGYGGKLGARYQW